MIFFTVNPSLSLDDSFNHTDVMRKAWARLLTIGVTSIGLILGLSTMASPPALADTSCADPACQGIPTTKQEVAALIMQMYNTGQPGRVTVYGYPSLISREILPISTNSVDPICDVDLRSLQVVAIVAKKFGSANVTDLNRHCADDPEATCKGSHPSQVHCNTVPTIAVDFDQVGGMSPGQFNVPLLSFLSGVVPGGTWKENNCESGSFPNMTSFPTEVGCTHQHIDFRGTSDGLRLPSAGSTPTFLDVLKRRPSSNVGTPASGQEVFTIDAGGSVQSAWFTTGVGWSSFAPHGGTQMNNITVGYNSSGNEEVFATNASGEVFHRWFASGVGWSPWTSLGASAMHDLVVGYTSTGNLELYGIAGGVVYETWFTPGAGWANWASLGGTNMSSLTLSYNSLGNEEIFAIGAGGAAFSAYFTPGAGWSGWSSLGGSNLTQLAAITTQGAEELFAVGGDQKIYHKWFTPGSGWSAWASLGGTGMSNLVAGVNTQGNKEIFVTAGGVVYTTWFTPGVGWANWASLGSSGITSLSLGYATNGTEDLFGIGGGGAVFHTSFAQGIGWSNWASLGGTGMRFK